MIYKPERDHRDPAPCYMNMCIYLTSQKAGQTRLILPGQHEGADKNKQTKSLSNTLLENG